MTATYDEVKVALGNTLKAAIDGLRVYPHIQPDISPPGALIMPAPGEFLTYRTSNISYDLSLRVVLAVSRGADRSADINLSRYISPTGADSVYAAVDADSTLGGVVDDARVTAASEWGVVDIAEIPYLGCTFTVEVLLS